jgi:tRNA-(ms[2]io[6]A)-hydroxylase
VALAVADEQRQQFKAIELFLKCSTPNAWISDALANQGLLLVDHANCEKKAASTALSLTYRYTEYYELLLRLSKLAREELRHFEQVVELIHKRGIPYTFVSACGYAGELRKLIRQPEPQRLVDTLVVCAFIEARSCERFAALATSLDTELEIFYVSLLKSEARHFQTYINLARKFSDSDISERIAVIGGREAELIQAPASEFRFHSGPVTNSELDPDRAV